MPPSPALSSNSRAPFAQTRSRGHRNAKIKWIDGNGHEVACAVVERPGAEIRGPLKRHAVREIRKIRGVVRAKDPTKLVPRRKQIIVVAQIDRKSTRLNSSHRTTAYAVFC